MSNFHSLEVVGRGSETQLQVGENLNMIRNIYGFKQWILVGNLSDKLLEYRSQIGRINHNLG